MALTLEKEPANPLFSKNEVAYQISTDSTDPQLRIMAHLYMESAPYTDTWVFVKKLQAWPDPNNDYKAEFYLHDILDAIMEYEDPASASGVVDSQVCRRIKMEYYEFLPSDLELIETLYSETYQMLVIDDLAEDNDYLLVMEYVNLADVALFQIGSGIDTAPDPDEVNVKRTLTDAYTLPSDFGYRYEKKFNIPAAHGTPIDDVALPANLRVKIYQWNKPTMTVTDERFVLKGGIDQLLFIEMTKDPDYWVDENMDNVVDEDGNLIIT